MKKKTLLAIGMGLFVHASIAQVGLAFQTAKPTKTPYSVQHVTVSTNGQIWAFGVGAKHGEGLYRRVNSNWTHVDYTLAEGIKVSACDNTGILLVNNKDHIRFWKDGATKWATYSGITKIKDVAISRAGGGTYAIGEIRQMDGTVVQGIFKTSIVAKANTDWVAVHTDAASKAAIRICDDNAGNMYMVDAAGALSVRYKGATANETIDTQGKVIIDVDFGGDGKVYALEKGGKVWQYTLANKSWTGMPLANLTTFGVDATGRLYGVAGDQLESTLNGKQERVTIENLDVLDGNGNTELTAAALLNDMDKAKAALAKGATPEFPNKNGDIAMTIAAKNGNIDFMNLLLAHDADPDAKDGNRKGHTALYYAVEKGNKKMAQALLLGKSNPNADPACVSTAVRMKNKEMLLLLSTYEADLTPGFTEAVAMNDAQMFQNLVNYGGKINGNGPFEKAVDMNNKDIARICLDNGSNPDSALVYSIEKENSDMISLCLEKRANPAPVIDYAIKKSDVALTGKLIDQYGVKADDVLRKAIPEPVAQIKGQQARPVAFNKPIAELALQRKANGDPYLPNAIQSNNRDLYTLLLNYATDINKALEIAVTQKNIEVATIAIQKGAKSYEPQYIRTAIVTNNDTPMATLLLNNGAPATDPELIKAAVNNDNKELTNLLFQKGASAMDPELMRIAVSKNNVDLVNTLVQYGADPTTGLKAAVDGNNTQIARLLIDKGASVLDPGLISMSASKGNAQITEALVNKGALPDNGVIGAINGGHESIFNYLIDKGATPQKQDYVVAAVRQNRTGIFNRLMDLGAPTSYVGSSNENLLHLACRASSIPITEKLIAKGVDVNQRTSLGETPLHFAVAAGRNNIDLAAMLIDAGSDVNAKNNRGKSIYKMASGQKLKKYLKSRGASK